VVLASISASQFRPRLISQLKTSLSPHLITVQNLVKLCHTVCTNVRVHVPVIYGWWYPRAFVCKGIDPKYMPLPWSCYCAEFGRFIGQTVGKYRNLLPIVQAACFDSIASSIRMKSPSHLILLLR